MLVVACLGRGDLSYLAALLKQSVLIGWLGLHGDEACDVRAGRRGNNAFLTPVSYISGLEGGGWAEKGLVARGGMVVS
jgi:hypothetical protein